MLDGNVTDFLVSADIYLSNVVCATLRKPKGRPEKRDGDKHVLQGINESKRVKEKASWLTLSKDSPTAGQWRYTLCRLSELESRCVLNIYVDESVLFCIINLHLVHTADIRLADKSLLEKRHCISVHCTDPGQYWSVVPNQDPIYLAFEDAELCNTWLTLLRSYAIPEVYGRTYSSSDGGFYRMCRKMDLTIHSVRNLTQKAATGSKPGGLSGSGLNPTPITTSVDPEVADANFFCDVWMNNMVCGRTTTKKLSPISMWNESFSLQDLPPFEVLEIAVWRDKKSSKSTYVGSTTIAPNNFRRGVVIDAVFPILLQGVGNRDTQVGEMKLMLKVDEELVLPLHQYGPIVNLFRSRNSLDWLDLFKEHLNLTSVHKQVLHLAIANNTLVEDIQELVVREIANNTQSLPTVFRGNTLMSKMMELSMAHYGKAFLEASIGPVLRRLLSQKVTIERETQGSNRGAKDKDDKNSALLIYWCKEFWDGIYATRGQCPEEMRCLFESIRKLVEQAVHKADSFEKDRELPWQSVSAFCFLRFIVPAILNPHLFGLHWGSPPDSTALTLKQIARVMQSLANLSLKDEDSRDAKDWFCFNNREAMIDYLFIVSTPSRETAHASSSRRNRSDRAQVTQAIHKRALSKSLLDREALALPPHPFDVPLQMATIISAVIRSHRTLSEKKAKALAENRDLYEFCVRCYDVERITLDRVDFLATHMRPGPRSRSPSPDYSLSPIERIPTPVGERSFSNYRSSARPATAPTQSGRRQFSPLH